MADEWYQESHTGHWYNGADGPYNDKYSRVPTEPDAILKVLRDMAVTATFAGLITIGAGDVLEGQVVPTGSEGGCILSDMSAVVVELPKDVSAVGNIRSDSKVVLFWESTKKDVINWTAAVGNATLIDNGTKCIQVRVDVHQLEAIVRPEGIIGLDKHLPNILDVGGRGWPSHVESSSHAPRYYVMWHIERHNVEGQVFKESERAHIRFSELDGGAHAAMLTDDEFHEIKYYGPRGIRLKDFKTRWKTLILEESPVYSTSKSTSDSGMAHAHDSWREDPKTCLWWNGRVDGPYGWRGSRVPSDTASCIAQLRTLCVEQGMCGLCTIGCDGYPRCRQLRCGTILSDMCVVLLGTWDHTPEVNDVERSSHVSVFWQDMHKDHAKKGSHVTLMGIATLEKQGCKEGEVTVRIEAKHVEAVDLMSGVMGTDRWTPAIFEYADGVWTRLHLSPCIERGAETNLGQQRV